MRLADAAQSRGWAIPASTEPGRQPLIRDHERAVHGFRIVAREEHSDRSDVVRIRKCRRRRSVERFDHLPDGTRVHMEDFAPVFDLYPANKYKKASSMNIARVLGIETPQEDVREFIRRLVFNALIGNSDMHLKNWSLTYPDRRHPRLSPAYDFVSTTAYIPDETSGLKFSRSKYYKDLTLDELAHMADRANLPEQLVLNAAKETVQRFHEAWSQERPNLPLSEDVIHAVERQLSLVPLARL